MTRRSAARFRRTADCGGRVLPRVDHDIYLAYPGGMGLNIKNERTHALVRELAALTGESQTSAIEEAVRRRLEELQASDSASQSVVGEIAAISTDFQRGLTPAQRTELLRGDEELYDDAGLPR